nr:uroporphyrinogen decarboxylase family protein [Candidatus Sigynarchaeum springense]
MNPTDRIIAAAEGQELDTVPTFCYLTDLGPAYQVLGKPRVNEEKLRTSWIGKLVIGKLGMGWPGKMVMQSLVKKTMFTCVDAAVEMGFDGALAIHGSFLSRFPDDHTIQDDWGSYNEIVVDKEGNGTYFYREPKIKTQADYEAWPYFPDPDKIARRTYKYFKQLVEKHGNKICLFGDAGMELYSRLFLAMGIDSLVINMRKNPAFVRQFIQRLEEFSIKNVGAMMDAGVRVILREDDFSFKTGPQMNPKMFDEFWGPSYTRICQYIHDRKGKAFIHSCGDNTKMFDYFIKWGFDGGHAFETTSNVDIFKEKRLHGDRFTIIGGMGVDYHLTSKSKPEEVVARTRELVERLGPGGRFIISNVHCLPTMDMTKMKVMLQAVKELKRPMPS